MRKKTLRRERSVVTSVVVQLFLKIDGEGKEEGRDYGSWTGRTVCQYQQNLKGGSH